MKLGRKLGHASGLGTGRDDAFASLPGPSSGAVAIVVIAAGEGRNHEVVHGPYHRALVLGEVRRAPA
eukprot:CAMPEP_0197560760 /NCGR_PEP_ID=MMETSP1320-20131121/23839_1 /TAXON_ID=91990 /ORGANISM="Bolidomonas sp., Strain RCC2347" /LENGTH=66 /DNA_ID=CAMNT_0043122337 /DNA_START=66 /DNA_END=263 /DNA_ORIENTATION=+